MEDVFNKSEHIEQIRISETELAYKKLCEFERNHCEDISLNTEGSIIYKVDPSRLAELEDICVTDLKDSEYIAFEYSSYEKLFESKYKERFLKNVAAISPKELEKKLGRDTLEQAARKDSEVRSRYNESIKERDLDNDGIPDRIDIDDSRNSVQTVADLNILKHTTSKDTARELEKKRSRQKEDIEL